MLAVKGGATVGSSVAIATAVGVIGTIFHNFMMLTNSFWNHRAISCINKGDYKGLLFNHFIGPQVLQMAYRIIPTAAILFFGADLANNIIAMFPVDSFTMRTLTALGGMLPAVGVAILLRQVIKKNLEIVYFLFGFTLVACLGINMIALAIIGAFFALLHFNYTILKGEVATAGGNKVEDDEEDDL